MGKCLRLNGSYLVDMIHKTTILMVREGIPQLSIIYIQSIYKEKYILQFKKKVLKINV